MGFAVEFSILTGRRFYDETKAIYRNADHADIKTGGWRRSGCGVMPRARHEQREFLQMAQQIWRHGCVDDFTDEST